MAATNVNRSLTKRVIEVPLMRELTNIHELETLLNESGQGCTVSSIRLPLKAGWSLSKVADICFEDFDFNSVMLGGLFSRPAFRRCRFVRCRWDGVNAQRTQFGNCEFDNNTWGEHTLASFLKCEFAKSSFHKCDFNNVIFDQMTLSNLQLTDTRWTRLQVKNSAVTDVSLAGLLAKVNIVSSKLVRVNLSDTAISEIAIANCTMSECRFPTRIDSFFIPTRAISIVASALPNGVSNQTIEELNSLGSAFARTDLLISVDKKLLSAIPAADRSVIISLLFQHAVK